MSNSKTIIISKEEAKRMIDASPSDKICVTIIDTENQTSGDTESVMKSEGCCLIEQARKIGYENHDIFGRFELKGVKKEQKGLMHCLAFVQGSPPTEKYLE